MTTHEFETPQRIRLFVELERGDVVLAARDTQRTVVRCEGTDAEDDEGLVGVVQVIAAGTPNQPHRGDVAKMLVHRRGRRRGVAQALLAAAEDAGRELGLTLLVLDTVAGGDAERLYARGGWVRVGVIPNYALMPDGTPCATTYFYKDL